MGDDRTTYLRACVNRLRDGDPTAREELIEAACERLRALARAMIRGDRLRRWEETDDVLQQSLLRLHRALAEVKPATVREFMRLAAWHIRMVLIQMARHYYRPQGLGANYQSDAIGETSDDLTSMETPARDATPSAIVDQAERWNRLHLAVEQLPEDEHEVVELLWFHGLTQIEAAEIAGITERTVQRRWTRARLKLYAALNGELPGMQSRR